MWTETNSIWRLKLIENILNKISVINAWKIFLKNVTSKGIANSEHWVGDLKVISRTKKDDYFYHEMLHSIRLKTDCIRQTGFSDQVKHFLLL